MHETHLIEPIIKGISEHALKEGAKKVKKVSLKVGMLTCSNEESFRQAFIALSAGTMLENAELDITFFPGTIIQVLSFDID